MKTRFFSFVLVVYTLLVFAGCREEKFNIPVEELTRDGYFILRETNETGTYGPVIILPERHDSRLIQAEFAWALDMMMGRKGIRSIALEGMFAGEKMAGKKIKYRTDDEKYAVLLAMLEKGEIKAPEFMYLAKGSTVFGIEDKAEYAVTYTDDDHWAYEQYLAWSIYIDQGEEVYDQGVEAYNNDEIDFDTFLSLNPWALEARNIIRESLSETEKIIWLEKLEKKIEQNINPVDAKTRAGFRRYKDFYETAHKRSFTMAGNVYQRLRKKNQPLAMIIGAAHTEDVTSYFDENNVSYYVLEPSGLNAVNVWSDLTYTEYIQKDGQKAVFVNKEIEAFFEKTRNLRPRVGVDSFTNANGFYLLSSRMTGIAASGQPPKNPARSFLTGGNLRIVWESIEFIGSDDVMFYVENQRSQGVYVRLVKNNWDFRSGNIGNIGGTNSTQKALYDLVSKFSQLNEENMAYVQNRSSYESIETFNVGGYTALISITRNPLREIDIMEFNRL